MDKTQPSSDRERSRRTHTFVRSGGVRVCSDHFLAVAWADSSQCSCSTLTRHALKFVGLLVGETPPAYLTLEDAKSPAEVFSTYVQGMMKMGSAGTAGQTGDGVGRRSASERSRNTEMGRKP